MCVETYCVNHVVHQLVNFGSLEPRLPAIPHDFGVGTFSNKQNSETLNPSIN